MAAHEARHITASPMLTRHQSSALNKSDKARIAYPWTAATQFSGLPGVSVDFQHTWSHPPNGVPSVQISPLTPDGLPHAVQLRTGYCPRQPLYISTAWWAPCLHVLCQYAACYSSPSIC